MRLKLNLWLMLSIGAALFVALLVLPWAWSRVITQEVVTLHLDEEEVLHPPRDRAQLRLGTYNIAHGRGLSRSNWTGEDRQVRHQRLLDIAQLLAAHDLDVVVLNEVDFCSSWSHCEDQAQVIASAAGYGHIVEVPNMDFRIGHLSFRFGNAILSRYPLHDAEVIDLPGYSRVESIIAGKKRGVAVTVEAPQGHVRVLGVHLSHRSEGVRVASAEHLIALTHRCALPVIIAGDTNSTPTDFPESSQDATGRNAMERLDATGMWRRHPLESPDEGSMTFHSARPSEVIDWILVQRPWTIEGYQVIHTELSDHRPVAGTFSREVYR